MLVKIPILGEEESKVANTAVVSSREISIFLQKMEALHALDRFETLFAWSRKNRSADVTVIVHLDDRNRITAVLSLAPCDLVTQWGTRFPLKILYEVYAAESASLRQLVEAAKVHCSNSIGLLAFFEREHSLDVPESGIRFVRSWEYIVTTNGMVDESHTWFLPINMEILNRNGGEVDLPLQAHLLFQ